MEKNIQKIVYPQLITRNYSILKHMKTELNQQTALQILINAANAACQKGAFNLQDAKVIAEAVEVFTRETPRETAKIDPEKDGMVLVDTDSS